MSLSFRNATPDDHARLVELESACFPPSQGASAEALRARLATYPDHFWLAQDEGRILAYACGLATDREDLEDDMYANAGLHQPDGAWQMLFSVCTDPAFRHRGLALKLLEHVIGETEKRAHRGLVLTCLPGLVPLYARVGFEDEGLSPHSTHGGVAWHQMRLVLPRRTDRGE